MRAPLRLPLYSPRQRGAVNLIAVLFLFTAVMAMLAVVMTMTATDIFDSSMQSRSVEALLLADSGMESAAWKFGSTGLCTAAGVSAGAATYALGSGRYSIDSAMTTDFAGAALTAKRCRIQTTGVTSGNVTRVLQAIVDRSGNALPPSANADFNLPAGACVSPGCSPTGWILSASGSSLGQMWDDTGGPDGSRAAYVSKSNGPTAGTTAGQFSFSPPVSFTGPTTLTILFDYKHEIGEPAGGTMGLTFSILQQAPGVLVWTTAEFLAAKANGYRAGSITLSIPQSGTFAIDKLNFSLQAKAGQAKQIWLDNIVLQGPGGGGGTTRVIAWREPVTP
ncbi:MAG: hypothetical protein OEV31_00295 [Gammaproteobacteria bacterium]|nr:hypothetical protein [Gammaproteobacteria bacterium]